MKIIDASKDDTQIYLTVWLDETKLVDNQPDPEYLFSISWDASMPVAKIKQETKTLCQQELKRRKVRTKVAALDNFVIT